MLPCLSLALNKTLFPYCLVCTRELQFLLDGHQLSPYKVHLHRWATNIAYVFFYNFSWQVNIQTACNHSADISNKSSGRTKYLWLCMLTLSANARTNSDEVGIDHMNTRLKVTSRLLTNNCIDFFPTGGDQYIGFIIYKQIYL